jgi:hypothetical protein
MDKAEAVKKINQDKTELEEHLPMDKPQETGEAELAGPWDVQRSRGKWGVRSVHDGEFYSHYMPWKTAALFAAILPAAGRPPIYDFAPRLDLSVLMTAKPGGFGNVGQIERRDDRVLTPLHTAHCLLLSPSSLAWLLLAADGKALERAAKIVEALEKRWSSAPPHAPPAPKV